MTAPAAPPSPSPLPATRFVRRLGPHHFAHLRAVAEGLPLAECARRYLGVAHGHEALTAHQEAVDAVRAVARRRAEPAWRLVGLRIQAADAGAGARPALDEFAAAHALEGFGEAEVLALYEEAWPLERKAARRQRLRQRQLELLRRLEGLAAETPQASDLVSGWFEEATAQRLITAGLLTLGSLASHIAAGGVWWRQLPAIGVAKAGRIARHLATLLPSQAAPLKPLFTLANASDPFGLPGALGALPMPSGSAASQGPVQHAGRLDAPPSLLQASSDREAVQSWIQARAGSPATVKVYQREAARLLLWLQYERQGATLARMQVDDCSAFMAFLENIPPAWISRARAAPGTPGWAPFRGPLSHGSCRQAATIVASLFAWLHAAQFISANPWLLVSAKGGDDPARKVLDSKALSEAAMAEVLRFIDGQTPSASTARIRFILLFVEAVGLRSAELLAATVGDLRLVPEGGGSWVMQVRGKGAKHRIAAVPAQALHALEQYLVARGLGSIQSAPPEAPLLASTQDPLAPVGYQALYEHVKGWLTKAVRASSLPASEREQLAGATTHWLRHTFGTRAIAREVPLDVIQAQMGHASIQTTTAIYGRAPLRRRVDALGKAFG